MYKTGIKINNQVAKIVIECANAEHRNEIAVAIREAGFELRP